MSESTLSIVRIHNELLGTYGDRGNADILSYRANMHQFKTEIIDVGYRDELPSRADIYLLGGAEDAAQVLSCEALRNSGLKSAVDSGAVVLAVCAGFQIIGESYFANGTKQSGLGLIDVTSTPGDSRYVGDIKINAEIVGVALTGFENHGGKTELGSGVQPLGCVVVGDGNGIGMVDGAVVGNIFGTYLHGPVLARNPEFADLLLSRAIGRSLPRIEDSVSDEYARWRRAATRK